MSKSETAAILIREYYEDGTLRSDHASFAVAVLPGEELRVAATEQITTREALEALVRAAALVIHRHQIHWDTEEAATWVKAHLKADLRKLRKEKP